MLNALNVEVTTGAPYTHTSNPLCERQNRVVDWNLRNLMKQERTKDWVRLVPRAVLTMKSQRSSSTGFTPHELFHGGRPAWFFKTPFPQDFKSPVGDWLEHKRSMANQAGATLRHIRDRELVLGMRKKIVEKSEMRQNNRAFHMKREQKIAHFMKNTLSFEKIRTWHPNQSHCDASGSTIRSLKHSLFLALWCLGICILVFPRGFWMVVVIAC